MYYPSHNFIRKSIFSNELMGAALILSYCLVYGVTAQIVLTWIQLVFFLSSVVFALSTYYVRDVNLQKIKAKKGILCSQTVGTILVIAYILVYGISGIGLLSGFQLIFFMSSFTFVISIFYLRDPERLKKYEEISASTTSPFIERFPCFIKNQDLSWLVRSLNSNLTTIVGFSELLLNRKYSEKEQEFMIRSINDRAIEMSHNINKASDIVNDSDVKPKGISKIVDRIEKIEDKIK